jgi:hypothetical protein
MKKIYLEHDNEIFPATTVHKTQGHSSMEEVEVSEEEYEMIFQIVDNFRGLQQWLVSIYDEPSPEFPFTTIQPKLKSPLQQK